MTLVTDIVARFRVLFPDGRERFTDSFIASLAHAADCVIREECEASWDTYDFSLYPGVLYYQVPEDVLAIKAVRFSRNGTTFNDGVLSGTSYDDLDRFDVKWVDRQGTDPTHYLVSSAPGVPLDTGPGGTGYSKILIWRPTAAATGQKIRIEYLSYHEANDSGFTAETARSDLIDLVYLPYILAAVYASVDLNMFVENWRKYREGIPRARAIFSSRYAEGVGSFRGDGPGIDWRQLP